MTQQQPLPAIGEAILDTSLCMYADKWIDKQQRYFN
jgi:hypothetical protein